MPSFPTFNELTIPELVKLANYEAAQQGGPQRWAETNINQPAGRALALGGWKRFAAMGATSISECLAIAERERAQAEAAAAAFAELEDSEERLEALGTFAATRREDADPCLIPDAWRGLGEALRREKGIPLAMFVPALYGVLSAFMHGAVKLDVAGRKDNVSLFVLIEAPPGFGKSTMLDAILSPFDKLRAKADGDRRELARSVAPRLDSARDELRVARSARTKARRQADPQAVDAAQDAVRVAEEQLARLEAQSREPAVLYTSSVSPVLVPNLCDCNHRLAGDAFRRTSVISAESRFLEQMVSDHGDMSILNEAWDGWSAGKVTRSARSQSASGLDVVSAGPIHLALVLCTQGSVIDRLRAARRVEEFVARGFLPRCIHIAESTAVAIAAGVKRTEGLSVQDCAEEVDNAAKLVFGETLQGANWVVSIPELANIFEEFRKDLSEEARKAGFRSTGFEVAPEVARLWQNFGRICAIFCVCKTLEFFSRESCSQIGKTIPASQGVPLSKYNLLSLSLSLSLSLFTWGGAKTGSRSREFTFALFSLVLARRLDALLRAGLVTQKGQRFSSSPRAILRAAKMIAAVNESDLLAYLELGIAKPETASERLTTTSGGLSLSTRLTVRGALLPRLAEAEADFAALNPGYGSASRQWEILHAALARRANLVEVTVTRTPRARKGENRSQGDRLAESSFDELFDDF